MRTANRLLTAALFGLTALASPTSAYAGPTETKYLQSLVGNWTGRGKVTGDEPATVSCRMTLKPSGQRLNFSGRCTYSGGSTSQSFSGRITYNERKGVFESTSRGNTVVGQRSGSRLVFTTRQNGVGGKGVSTMTLSPGGLNVSFDMVRNGERSKGSIPFSKG